MAWNKSNYKTTPNLSEPNILMQALAWNKPDSKQAKQQNYTWFR